MYWTKTIEAGTLFCYTFLHKISFVFSILHLIIYVRMRVTARPRSSYYDDGASAIDEKVKLWV